MKYFIGALLGFLLGIAEAEVDAQKQIGAAYGCGRHDGLRTAVSDPAEYESALCDAARKLWSAR